MEIDTQSRVRLFIRTNELAEALSISLSTLWRYRKAGLIPDPIALGPRTVGWRLNDINNWLNEK